jgi:hypothetical protein
MRFRLKVIYACIAFTLVGLLLTFNIHVNAQTNLSLNQKECPLFPTDSSGKEIPLHLNQNVRAENDGELRLGDTIFLTIDGLSDAISKDKNFDFNQLVLYLDGYPLRGIPVISRQDNQLAFKLIHNDEAHREWAEILGPAWKSNKQVKVNIGCLEGKSISGSSQLTIRLWKLASFRFLILLSSLIIFSILILKLLPGTIIRNSGLSSNRAFSLSRSQLAWWTCLVLIVFLVIFSITGDYNYVISGQSVMLLLLGGATTFGGALVDQSSDRQLTPEQKDKLLMLDDNRKNLIKQLKSKAYKCNNLQQINLNLKETIAEMNKIEQQSAGFFSDILTDPNGEINLHRFQLSIWTMVLGFIFIYQALMTYKMPEFDENLLLLTGVSSGIYLALKTQEKPTAAKNSVFQENIKEKEAPARANAQETLQFNLSVSGVAQDLK